MPTRIRVASHMPTRIRGGSHMPTRTYTHTNTHVAVKVTLTMCSYLVSHQRCNALFSGTDWFLTLVQGLAEGDGTTALPLDGYNQWEVLAGRATTNRTAIYHNVPAHVAPVLVNVTVHGKQESVYSTSTCMSYVDNRTGPCASFGATGGAIRVGDFKLLTTFDGPVRFYFLIFCLV
jgi:hypothetical protein